MIGCLYRVVIPAFLWLVAPLGSFANEDLVALQQRIVAVQTDHAGAVVTVFAQHRSSDPEQPASHIVGTGFFISREGLILTATNVIHGADRVWVENRGIGYLAEVVGSDRLTNVAILKLKAVPEELAYLRFPQEPELPPVGTLLVWISCELGMAPGPDLGLVNGWNTAYGERILPTVYLRTSLTLDGGENGAPVFDLNGNLVGMAIIGLPETRSSFLLPVRALERVRDDILFSGEVAFAHFGFTTMEIADRKEASRVFVEAIEPDSPAATAGIKVDDIILRVGAFAIDRDRDLRRAFFFTRPNEQVDVQVRRDGEVLTLPLKAGRRERPPTEVSIGPTQSAPPEPVQNADARSLKTPTAQEE